MIRSFDKTAHLAGVRACFIELQDAERHIEPRMPSGAEIVNIYVPHMLDRCRHCRGEVLVAEIGEEVAGFATVLAQVRSDEIHDGDIEYGLISDLVVASGFRNRGIGRSLLEAAESFARANEVKWLRIGVLAANQAADGLYDSMGFRKLYVEREKELT